MSEQVEVQQQNNPQNQNNGQQQQNNKGKALDIIIRLIAGIVVLVVIFKVIDNGSIFHALDGVSVKNGVYMDSTESSVYFYPKCPKCGHKETLKTANISDGESATYTWVCNSCLEVYKITVKR